MSEPYMQIITTANRKFANEEDPSREIFCDYREHQQLSLDEADSAIKMARLKLVEGLLLPRDPVTMLNALGKTSTYRRTASSSRLLFDERFTVSAYWVEPYVGPPQPKDYSAGIKA